MKLAEIYALAIDLGMVADPRGRAAATAGIGTVICMNAKREAIELAA